MNKILVFTMLLFNLNCSGQIPDTITDIDIEIEEIEEIEEIDTEAVCTIRLCSPFIIKNAKKCIENDSIEGGAVITLFVDNNAELKYFNILKLDIKYVNCGKKVKYHQISFEQKNKDDYPIDIQPFFTFIENYVSTLEVEKTNQYTKAYDMARSYLHMLKIGKCN